MKVTKVKHYLVSDLHLFHQRIIKYADRTKYVDSEKGTMDMTYDIVNFINENIPDEPGVMLWLLGDIFYGPLLNEQSLEELQRLVSIMRGKNRALKLVLGNHDRDFRSLDWKKTTKNLWIEDFSDYHLFRKFGFDYVYDYPIVFGNFIFSHEPVFLSKDSAYINIHGHTHNTFVDENYFTWKCENHDMVIKAFKSIGRELPKNIDAKNDNWETMLVDPHKYINASWDATNVKPNIIEMEVNPTVIDVSPFTSKQK